MITWILALYVGGMLLLLSELVMPGLVCGVLGAALVLGSMVMTVRNYPDNAWLLLAGEVLLGVLMFAAGMWILPKLGARLGLFHTSTMDAEAGFVSAPELPALVGRVGVAEGMLRPAGIVHVDGVRYDVVTEGDFIEPGARVRVIAAEGNRIVVERAS